MDKGKREVTNLELLDSINRSFSKLEEKISSIDDRLSSVEENMVTKNEFHSFKLETNIHFNNLESDLKSFKNETRESFVEVNDKLDDLSETVIVYDKRIEKLEDKVFV